MITKEAITDEGLFLIHKVDENIYYEVPDSLLGREMLLVSRIVALPARLGNGYINAGSKTNEQVVRWVKNDKALLLKSVSHSAIASDSLPIFKSVIVNNYEPIIYSFKVEAINNDSTGSVIKINKFFTSDVPAISPLSSGSRKQYEVKRLDDSRTFISSTRSFPLNIEVRHDMTYSAGKPPSNSKTGSISIQMNQSMIILPKTPMKSRLYDPRVGWFTVSQIDYGSDKLKADSKRYIRRWKLEPKDPEAYARGELVEPVKPIVYYLDPATPEKWRPYFRQGIEDWQMAFETAGFKNAIIARDPPKDDPDFSPEDVRYSTVRYVASTTRNAMGPSVSDPRSGEIIESDIIWYHNHLRSYRNRYLLETGAANPSARTLDTPEKEIGEMMRMVIAHEVGHALGLPHNMKASSAYPVDSLRSGSFTKKYGIAATIMDYARYNYVAQPGDKNIRFVRQIGPYDHYAINWGYRYLEGINTEKEKETLNSWIKVKEGDPKYLFGGSNGYDPSSQTEDIGDNPVMASTYGLSNLKIVAQNLVSWTTKDGVNYDDLDELHGEMIGVWNRYIGHVVTVIGGVNETRKTADQNGAVYQVVPKRIQKQAMNFMLTHAFDNSDWLVDKSITRKFEHAGTIERIRSIQSRYVNRILDFGRLQRLLEAELYEPGTYTCLEMMDDLRKGLWKELRSGKTINIYRRNLQRAYLERMAFLMTEKQSTGFGQTTKVNVSQSDIRPIVRGQLAQLKRDVINAKTRTSDRMTQFHLNDVLTRIEEIVTIDK